MRVLGIDPGLTRCGLGIVSVSRETKNITFEHVEVLRTSAATPLAERIFNLGSSIEKVLKSNTISELAIERVFVGENLPSVMGVAQITGVVIFLAARMNIPVTFYSPNEIKSNITGYGAANKIQVTNMVMKSLGLKTAPKPADAADALAIAITHARSLRGMKNNFSNSSDAHRVAKLTPAKKAWIEAEKRAKSKR